MYNSFLEFREIASFNVSFLFFYWHSFEFNHSEFSCNLKVNSEEKPA